MNLQINQSTNLVQIIDEQIKSGQFFSITWVKKNGELRTASVKKCKWINTSGISRQHPEKYICLVDMNKLQKNGNGYVLINKESILSVKANGKVYTDWIKTMFAQNLGLIEIGTL
jgi:hypothetical protein